MYFILKYFSFKSERLISWRIIIFKLKVDLPGRIYERKTQLRALWWFRAPLYFNDRSSQPP